MMSKTSVFPLSTTSFTYGIHQKSYCIDNKATKQLCWRASYVAQTLKTGKDYPRFTSHHLYENNNRLQYIFVKAQEW